MHASLRVHLSRCPPTAASRSSPTRTPCPTSGPIGRSARTPAGSAACCSSPSKLNTTRRSSTTPPLSLSPEPRPLWIVCCSPCAPPTPRRSSHCWASSRRRPHRVPKDPRPCEQGTRPGTTPGSVGPTLLIRSPPVRPAGWRRIHHWLAAVHHTVRRVAPALRSIGPVIWRLVRCQEEFRQTSSAMPAILQPANVAPRRSRRVPAVPRSSAVTSNNSASAGSAIPWRPCPLRLIPRGLASGGGKVEGNPGAPRIQKPERHAVVGSNTRTKPPMRSRRRTRVTCSECAIEISDSNQVSPPLYHSAPPSAFTGPPAISPVNDGRKLTPWGRVGSRACRNTPFRQGVCGWADVDVSGSWMWRPNTGSC
jgi:hypothetical protein